MYYNVKRMIKHYSKFILYLLLAIVVYRVQENILLFHQCLHSFRKSNYKS